MNGQDCGQLTLFPEDSRASLFPSPGSAEAVRMTVTSGLKCCALLKNSGPLGSLAKMLLESSIWRSTRCYLTWKPKATPQGRLLFRLAPSTPRTDGTGSPLWLGTMTASQTGGNHSLRSEERRKGRVPSPAEFVMLWPTPTARNGTGASNSARRQGSPDLQTAVMFPTPTTGASLCGGTGNYQQLKALEQARVVSEEERRSMAAGNGGQLNPTWVEWLMGFPIGWTDLEASGTP